MDNNVKVLIVDDNKMNIKIASRLIDSLGYQIEECYDGTECIAKIESGNKYDIILMDLMMPNLGGLETVKLLRSKYNVTIPIIAVTADATEGIREKSIAAGCNDYISKPVYKDMLIDMVQNCLKMNEIESL